MERATALRTLAASLVALAAATFFSDSASAAPVVGKNVNLTSTGSLYIPFTFTKSGDIGSAGKKRDTVTLTEVGETATGYVKMLLNYDLRDEYPEGFILDPTASSDIRLNFVDVDFKPQAADSKNYATFWETMDIGFVRDTGGYPYPGPTPGVGSALHLDQTNYGNYRLDGFGETNTKDPIEYIINLRNDLGLTDADFALINETKEFQIEITLTAFFLHNVSGKHTYSNTAEKITQSFIGVATPIPDPATLMLLGPGGLWMLVRRLRRK